MALVQQLNSPRQRSRWHRVSPQRFLRGEGPETGPIHLVQRRVYILPTRRGLFFALLTFVMLIGSMNYNNSLGFSLTFLLASLGIVAILHTYRNLLHLSVDVGPITPVFCGDPVRVPVILQNSHYPARYAVNVFFPKHPKQDPVYTDVPANHWTRIEANLPTQKRGMHQLERMTLQTIFPLGLFRAWAHAQINTHYLVYPKPDQQKELPRESLYHFNLSGDRGNGSDDFAGLRNYHIGDSLHHVHWKAMAREQGMQTKQFGGDRAEELWLDWESLPELDSEERLSRLTRWVIDADTMQYSYGLRLPDIQIPLGNGPEHKHRCLEALALYPNNSTLPKESGPAG